MKGILFLIGIICFLICSTASANVAPDGYSTYIESSDAQIATKHNGQAVYIENSTPDNKIYIDVTVQDAVFWFSDGSYIQIDPINEKITQVGRLRPRTGDRKRDTYHISVLGREPVWEITSANRQLWERFTEFSDAYVSSFTSSTTLASSDTSLKVSTNRSKVGELTEFVTQTSDACEAERDNAEHGYLGHRTLASCHSSEDNQLIVAALGDLIGCASPAAAVGVCALAIAHHVWAAGEKQEKVYQCTRARDASDRDLRICEEAANNSGGGGGVAPGTGGGVNNGGIPTPTLRCAEWIQLKNTTIGDVTYCSRWTIQ